MNRIIVHSCGSRQYVYVMYYRHMILAMMVTVLSTELERVALPMG